MTILPGPVAPAERAERSVYCAEPAGRAGQRGQTVSLISGFERRLERAVEGFFARVFKSGVHPVEIGKRLLRVMEDGKTVALRRTYVPNVYRIVLSEKDHGRLAPLEHQLVEELEVFVSEAARQRTWVLADSPRVSFAVDERLSTGEFRIQAEAVSVSRSERRSDDGQPAVADAPVAPGTGEPSLIIYSDDRPTKTLSVAKKVTIGRQSDNDLVIPDPGVSRHHAEIANEGGTCTIRDLGSTNGTVVNGTVVREHRLQDGDRVTLGRTVVEFRRG